MPSTRAAAFQAAVVLSAVGCHWREGRLPAVNGSAASWRLAGWGPATFSRPAPLGARLAGPLFDPRLHPNLLPNALGQDGTRNNRGNGTGRDLPPRPGDLCRRAVLARSGRRSWATGAPRKALVGDRGRARTCNPQLRRLMLYPVELRGHVAPFNRHHGSLATPLWVTLSLGAAKGGEASRALNHPSRTARRPLGNCALRPFHSR